MKKLFLLIMTVAMLTIVYAVPLKQTEMGNILYDKGIHPDATYPVTLEQAKAQLKIEISETSEDKLIQDYIESATDEAERFIEQDIVKHIYQLDCEKWYQDLLLPRYPVIEIESIKYIDENGDIQTLDSDKYKLIPLEDEPDKMTIHYADFDGLPTLASDKLDAVQIIFHTGMDSPKKGIGQAIKLIMTNFYEQRGDMVERLPKRSESLLRKYRKYA